MHQGTKGRVWIYEKSDFEGTKSFGKMNINLIKRSDGSFLPAYPSDYDNAKKFKVGEECNFTYKKIRNTKFHKKYFAMIRMLFDNQEQFENAYAFRKWLEAKAGYYDAVMTDSGTFFCPKSIAYDKVRP